MTIEEQIAHLQGLAEGLNIQSENSKEARLLTAMLEVLTSIGQQVGAMQDALADDEATIDLLAEDLEYLQRKIRLDSPSYWPYPLDWDEDEDWEDEDEDEDEEEEEDLLYVVKCPECGEELTVDENDILSGNIRCESCGRLLTIELSDADEGDEEEEEEEAGEDNDV